MTIKLTWSEMKQVVADRALNLQAFMQGPILKVFAFDDRLTFACEIDPDDDAADYAEYQSSYEPNVNRRPKQPMVPSIGVDDSTLNCVGFMFEAELDQQTTSDHLLDQPWFFKRGVMETKDYTPGDFMSMSIIDKDNVTGLGAMTVLSMYVAKWYIMSGQNFVANEVAGRLPTSGLYLRFQYTSTATTGPKPSCFVNLINYLPI